MAAGERARRRAEREHAAAQVEAARRADAERQARRTARRDRLTRWLPSSAGQSGTLAARKRQRAGLVVAFVVALNVLVWLATDEWAARVFFLMLCVLVAPIATTLLTRK